MSLMKRKRRVRVNPFLLVALSATCRRRPHRLLMSHVEAKRKKKSQLRLLRMVAIAIGANNRSRNSSRIHIRKESQTRKGTKLRTRRVTEKSEKRGTRTTVRVRVMRTMEVTRNMTERRT